MTGTGKTLIYLLPILQKLSADPIGIAAVVFAPTRELATLIHQQFEFYGKAINLRTCLLTGGVDALKQSVDLDRIPHVVVATPGRFFDLLTSNPILKKYTANLKFLVLDEFDQLLNDSLVFFVKKSIDRLPKERQIILTTATFAENEENMKALEDKLDLDLKGLTVINKNRQLSVVDTLSHYYVFVPHLFKDYYFFHILQKKYAEITDNDIRKSIIVFFKRCKDCHFWAKLLSLLKIDCVQIHSYIKQDKRSKNLLAFKEGRVNILLSTDLGARGLDIRAVEWVINYDFPRDYRDYVHRAGRAARGGERGNCLSILTQHSTEQFKEMEKQVKAKVGLYKTDEEEEVMKCMNKIDRLKRKLKIHFLVKGVDERFEEIRKKKIKFQKGIRKDK